MTHKSGFCLIGFLQVVVLFLRKEPPTAPPKGGEQEMDNSRILLLHG